MKPGCTCSDENLPIYQKYTSSYTSSYTNKFLHYDCSSSSWVISLEYDYAGGYDFKPSYFSGATIGTLGTGQCPYSGSPACLASSPPPPPPPSPAASGTAVVEGDVE